MKTTAATIPDAAIRERRTIHVTGRLIGTIPTANTVTLMGQVAADEEVEMHKEEKS